jgi:carbon monoxide dehydrogenase subunit G
MRFDTEVTVRRPPAEVFAFLSDIERIPLWVEEMRSVRPTSPAPLALGSTFEAEASFLGRSLASPHTVTGYEPDHLFAYRAEGGPLPGTLRYTFAPAQGGTRVRVEAEVEPAGAYRLAGPLLRSAGRGVYRRSLERLKRVLEGTTPAG